jgi:hypothetical protein
MLSTRQSRIPAAENRFAAASPIPIAAPVTTATLPGAIASIDKPLLIWYGWQRAGDTFVPAFMTYICYLAWYGSDTAAR